MPLSEDEYDRLVLILDTINTDTLRDRERQFVNDQRGRLEEHGTDMTLSRKQWAWLESIFERF